MIDLNEINFLSVNYTDMEDDELLNSLGGCSPLQTQLIMDHIRILDKDGLIGYHHDDKRVFVLIDEDLMEISKKK